MTQKEINKENQNWQPEHEDVLLQEMGEQLDEPPKCHLGYWVE